MTATMWAMVLSFVAALGFLTGCNKGDYLMFIDGLNEREVQSCVTYTGSMRAMGGHVGVVGITGTGGVKMAECDRILQQRTVGY